MHVWHETFEFDSYEFGVLETQQQREARESGKVLCEEEIFRYYSTLHDVVNDDSDSGELAALLLWHSQPLAFFLFHMKIYTYTLAHISYTRYYSPTTSQSCVEKESKSGWKRVFTTFLRWWGFLPFFCRFFSSIFFFWLRNECCGLFDIFLLGTRAKKITAEKLSQPMRQRTFSHPHTQSDLRFSDLQRTESHTRECAMWSGETFELWKFRKKKNRNRQTSHDTSAAHRWWRRSENLTCSI